ncbi:hypothetical protein ABBQ38_011832 [Trebouxia sp. C0009 RCD-2024]
MASKYGTQTVDSLAQEPSALPVQLIGLSDCPATEVRAERSNHRTIAKAQLHAVGSIADISANWSAKVVVASNEQADRTKMAAVYDSMSATLLKDGLNLAAVAAIRQFYGKTDAQPEPLFYEHFPTPLQQGAVRLVVFQPVQAEPLIQLAHSACHDVLGSLPPGMQPHASLPSSFHLTVFMTSQPGDPRPDPFTPGGGIDATHPPVPIPAASAATLQREVDTFRQIALTARPAFEVHSVVFANSGTVLLCLVDTTSQLSSMRQRISKSFPGASSKQSSIMHMTLGRVLQPRQLQDSERQAVQQQCNQWTSKLKGHVFKPDTLWHIQEHQFTTVAGVQTPLPLATIER